jgi:hypothetical protein
MVRITIARKVKSGSSRWPSCMKAMVPAIATTSSANSVTCG